MNSQTGPWITFHTDEGIEGDKDSISMVVCSSDFNIKRGLRNIRTKFDGISLRKHSTKHAQAKMCVYFEGLGENGIEDVRK